MKLFEQFEFQCIIKYNYESLTDSKLKGSQYIKGIFLVLQLLAFNLYSQNQEWKVLHDVSTQYALNDVIESSDTLQSYNDKVFNFSYVDYPVWMISSISATTKQKLFVENPTLGYIDFFVIDQSGKLLKEINTGNYLKVSTREVSYPSFIFNIPKSDAPLTIVLRAQSSEPLILPYRIVNEDKLTSYLFEREIVGLIVLGIIISLIVLYVVIFISLQDKSYLLYLFFAASILITILRLNGYTAFWLWPELPVFNRFPAILEALPAITAATFARFYLDLKKYYPVMDKLILGMIALQVLVIPMSLIVPGNTAVIICETIALVYIPFITILSAFVYFIKKYRPARYFLISSVFLFTGSIIYILINFNVLEATNIFFRNSLQIGIALEMTFLAIGVSKRIDKLRKDYISVQEENVKILSNRKEELKEQVARQTSDLAAKNKALEETIRQLKSTQAQLVKSEKFAAIGTLTAGIAHEINNPINYIQGGAASVKSNVNDILQIDRLMIDSLNKLAEGKPSVQKTDDNVEEVITRINEEKDMLDYEELIEETYVLLDNILEGAGKTSEILAGLKVISSIDDNRFTKGDINKNLIATTTLLEKQLAEIDLQFDLDPNLDMIEYAPGRMSQVFLILINNAIDAMGDDGKLIISSKSHNGEGIEIGFRDNGSGISDEIKDQIFDPFFTTKPVGSGSGIGLSMALSIVENHHGEICFNSSPMNGTEFKITLPRKQS